VELSISILSHVILERAVEGCGFTGKTAAAKFEALIGKEDLFDLEALNHPDTLQNDLHELAGEPLAPGTGLNGQKLWLFSTILHC
jgi:hypothetical protein